MARILVMHADCAIRMVLQQVLAEDGHEVETAADGDSAIRMFLSEQPDLVILGFVLQKPCKPQVYSYIRHGLGLRDLPVIWLQSSLWPQFNKEPGEPVRVVYEPFDLYDVLRVVDELLPTAIVA